MSISSAEANPPYAGGRIQFDKDGVRYYSPNSTVAAVLNHTPLPKNLNNPFMPGKTGMHRVRYRDFVNPRPWDPKFGWIAFIPVVPTQWLGHHTYFGRLLSRLPRMERFTDPKGGKHGWVISQDNEWRRLEKDIYDAVVALSGHYHIPCVLPFLPNAIGYTLMYPHKHVLISRLEEARNWFFVWFGALSFLVTQAKERIYASSGQSDDELWVTVLHARGVAPAFADALVNSPVVERDQTIVRRAGVILDLLVTNRPTVQSLMIDGIPVWYRWSSKEEAANHLIRFRPPEHLMLIRPPPPPQGVTSTDLPQHHDIRPFCPSIEISPPADSSLGLVVISPPTTTQRAASCYAVVPTSPMNVSDVYDDEEPLSTSTIAKSVGAASASHERSNDNPEPEWISFFNSRKAAHARILQSETPTARQKRENRMREPATASARVFEWFQSEKDGVLYERFPVLGKARLDTLDGYGAAQKRYDPFFNEWDCCTQFGDDDDDDYEENEEILAKSHGDVSALPIPSAVASSFVPVAQPSASVPLSHAEVDRPTEVFVDLDGTSANALETESLEILTHFFGFQQRILHDGPSAAPGLTSKEKTFLLRALGVDATVPKNHAYFDTAHSLDAHDFIQSLCSRQKPQIGSWDLLDDCVRPVRLTARFSSIRKIQMRAEDKVDSLDRVERYYVFGQPSVSAWTLGMTNAASAMVVCRLPPTYSNIDIAAFLASYGIPFRTFHFSRGIPRAPSNRKVLVHEIPRRPFGHRFTKDDYDAYIHMRTLLLGQSHMQAAIKRGGIVWRLAVGTLGTSRIDTPPSLWGSTHHIELSGMSLVDDVLTTTEMDLICGAYECISADGKQRALKSWWPLARYYEKDECGENHGRWTAHRETWYSMRLEAIEKGDARQIPLTYTEWKRTQHGPTLIRNMHVHFERTCSELLESC